MKPNVLVVCGRNKRRSRTAEFIFKNDARFNIKSAGLSAQSVVQLNEKLIHWSDIIFVMDDGQRNRIQKQYKSLDIPRIENLEIDDVYEYKNEDLIEMLLKQINETLITVYNI
ncbi:MAG: protein-tyrosine-phosphatase [Saprospiraceae bacterium]|nr:protein-tyrosine-phosphatase [Candidatus Defluviibacterium haderslevense]